MKEISVLLFMSFMNFSVYGLTLKCVPGDERFICLNQDSPESQVKMLFRGQGISLNLNGNNELLVKCHKIKSIDQLINNQNGFFGNKASLQANSGIHIGEFRSQVKEEGRCRVYGASYESTEDSEALASITFERGNIL